jgi:hypothetical protein
MIKLSSLREAPTALLNSHTTLLNSRTTTLNSRTSSCNEGMQLWRPQSYHNKTIPTIRAPNPGTIICHISDKRHITWKEHPKVGHPGIIHLHSHLAKRWASAQPKWIG